MKKDKQSTIDLIFSGLLIALRFIWDVLKTAIVVAAIAFVIRFFLIEPFIVQGSSMEPNFHDMDYLLIEKVSDDFADHYKRGAVVVFHPPDNPKQNYIKRIVGLPSEKIYIRDQEVVVQNQNNPKGKVLNETYIPSSKLTEGTISAQLKNNQYYLLGDNRDNSKDSRSFGPVNEKQIIGRVWLAVFGQNGFRSIKVPSFSS